MVKGDKTCCAYVGNKLNKLKWFEFLESKKITIIEMKMMYCGKSESVGWMGLINKAADSEKQAKMIAGAFHCL